MPIWPLLRMRLCFDLDFQKLGLQAFGGATTSTEQRGLRAGFGRLRRYGRRAARLMLHEGRSLCPRHAPVPPADAVLLTQENRCTRMNGSYYHYISEPLRDVLAAKGQSLLALELGVGHQPRSRPAISVDAAIRRRAVRTEDLRRLSRPFRSRDVPGWFLQLQAWMRAEFGKQIEWDYIESRLWQFAGAKAEFERWLRRAGCRTAFVDCWYTPPALAFCAACASLGIRTIDYQHGAQGSGHYGYASWTSAPDGGYPMFPQFFWTWGTQGKEELLRENSDILTDDRVVVGGNPWMNRWLEAPSEWMRAQIASARSLRGGCEQAILVAFQPQVSVDPGWLRALIEAGGPNTFFFLRLHRNMLDEIERFEAMIPGQYGDRCSVREATQLPLYAMLKNVEGLITWYSTCALEALPFGVPSLVLSPTGHAVFQEFVAAGVMIAGGERSALNDVLSELDCIDPLRCQEAGRRVFAGSDASRKALRALNY